jgi:hypothetical protein
MPIAAHLPELGPGLLLAWLATYLLHSTLLLGAAWGASRLLRGRALGAEEALWKAALVGGLLTAAVQVAVAGFGAAPAGEVLAAVSGPVPVEAPGGLEAAVPPTALPPLAPAQRFEATGIVSAASRIRPAADPRLSTLAAVLPGWQRLLLAGWLLGAGALAARLALSWILLRARLRGRREVTGGPVRHLLDRLLSPAGAPAGAGGREGRGRRVRLTGSPALPVPVALGVGEREICLPRRALTDLGERRQRGLLAHELAHLERRDPAWLLASRAIECLAFLQPLNRLARGRLQEISELRCDEWAVAATGDRLGLARCLTEVAGWLVDDPAALPVPGMARSRKRLSERVKRILEGPADEPSARRRWLPAAAAALLLTGALLVPGLAPSSFAVPRENAPQGAAPEGGGSAVAPAGQEPAGAAPGAEGPAGEAPEGGGPEDFEYDHDYDQDLDLDQDFDYDYDFDYDLDFDPAELSQTVADALAAAHASMVDPAELAEIVRETREAMGEAEWARIQAEIERANEELERDLRLESEEVRHEVERAREEARRELELERRELEEQRRELARERERLRQELREEAEEPPRP